MPTGLPMIDDRVLSSFTQFANIIAYVNMWRAKRLSFIKAASSLAGTGTELNMRGALFAVVSGVRAEIDAQKSAIEAKYKKAGMRDLALEVSFQV